MKQYSIVSKIGIIISAIAMLISGISVLYNIKNGIKDDSLGFFLCTAAIFCANIVIAEGSKKK